MSGPPEQRVPLPIESRYDVTVRPAYRPSGYHPSWFETLLERSFDGVGWVLYPLVLVLLATGIVAQVVIHFHLLNH